MQKTSTHTAPAHQPAADIDHPLVTLIVGAPDSAVATFVRSLPDSELAGWFRESSDVEILRLVSLAGPASGGTVLPLVSPTRCPIPARPKPARVATAITDAELVEAVRSGATKREALRAALGGRDPSTALRRATRQGLLTTSGSKRSTQYQVANRQATLVD